MAFRTPKQNYKSILCIRANAVSDFRMDFAARYLDRAGFDVETITYVPFYKASQYDLVICSRPGIDMLEYLKVCLIAGKQVVIDLDDDFTAIPKHNPAFNYTGAGHPHYLTELRRVLSDPQVIVTYASAELQNRYKHDGIVIANSWDDENPNWDFEKVRHDSINIGFTGTATHREDFNIIEPVIKKLLDEYKNLRIVIQLDEQIYKRFNDYEMQRLFLPPLPFADYPLSYRMFDILVVPLRDTRFNRAKSDIKLLECGVSKTPYVASNLPFYSEWKEGGFCVADDAMSWEAKLVMLIENKKLREELGEAGYEKALARKASLVNNKWVELVEELCK